MFAYSEAIERALSRQREQQRRAERMAHIRTARGAWIPHGFHKHQCEQCGAMWAHSDNFASSRCSYETALHAHTCPRCNAELPRGWPQNVME